MSINGCYSLDERVCRGLELEIDGEMLSLLEKSDLVGGMGENGIKTGMDVVTAFEVLQKESSKWID